MKNKIQISGDIAIMEIVSKNEILECWIDKEDLPILTSFGTSWAISRSGNYGYINVRTHKQIDGKKVLYKLSNLILPPSKGEVVDHINGNPLDNRKVNLRLIPVWGNQQNLANLVRTNKSGYRGVNWYKPLGKWRAKACVNKKHYHLGYFDNKEEAAEVVKEFRRRHMPYSHEARGVSNDYCSRN